MQTGRAVFLSLIFPVAVAAKFGGFRLGKKIGNNIDDNIFPFVVDHDHMEMHGHDDQ